MILTDIAIRPAIAQDARYRLSDCHNGLFLIGTSPCLEGPAGNVGGRRALPNGKAHRRP
jgi:hypothetical protein